MLVRNMFEEANYASEEILLERRRTTIVDYLLCRMFTLRTKLIL